MVHVPISLYVQHVVSLVEETVPLEVNLPNQDALDRSAIKREAVSLAAGSMPYSFRNKHVFITGGTNGIGLAIARFLLVKGARLSLIDIADPSEALKMLDSTIKSCDLPGKVFFRRADVSSYDQVYFN